MHTTITQNISIATQKNNQKIFFNINNQNVFGMH